MIALTLGGWFQSRLEIYHHIFLLGTVIVVSQIPFLYGLSLAQIFRGVLGELSITTLILLAFWNLESVARFQQLQEQKRLLFSVIAIIAPPFYWAALGGAPVDPYGWGYANWYLFGILVVGSLLSGYRGYYFIPVVVLSVGLADMVQLLESANLWDYLFDPILAIYAIIITSRRQYILAMDQWRHSRQ